MFNIASILPALTSAEKVKISFSKEVKLNKGGTRGNPVNEMFGRVKKKTLNLPVRVYSSSNVFHAEVNAKKAAKGEQQWEPKQRAWGERVNNGPIIAHEKDGDVKFYLETEVLGKGETRYFLDQEQIEKDDITGLPASKKSEPDPNGIGDTEVRTFDLGNVESIEIDGKEFIGPFNFRAACPFCLETKKLSVASIANPDGDDAHVVYCESCKTSGPVADTAPHALRYWNNRAF